MVKKGIVLVCIFVLLFPAVIAREESSVLWVKLSEVKLPIVVTVTAYSSTKYETDNTPFLAACGPVGRYIIAVSDDLWNMGLRCGRVVYLLGQRYVVWDRMHYRWRKRVDVWLPSRSAAVRFGVRSAVLYILD